MNKIWSSTILILSIFTMTGNLVSAQFAETGFAVYYADYFQGKATAYGEVYNRNLYTCAHKTYPLGTLLRVTRVDNNRSVVVRVNDRGPVRDGYVVDLSFAAAQAIGLDQDGRTIVRVERVGFSNTNPVPSNYALTAPEEQYTEEPRSFTTRGAENVSSYNTYPGNNNTYNPPNTPSSFNTSYPGQTGNTTYPPGSTNPNNSTLTPKTPATTTSTSTGPIKRIAAGMGGFGVQIASYSNRDNAERQAQMLVDQGVQDVYITASQPTFSGVLFRVLVGRHNSRGEAMTTMEALKRQYGLNGFVTIM